MQIKAKMYDGKIKDYTIDVVILALLTDSGQYGGTPVAVYYNAETFEINSEYVDHFKFISCSQGDAQ